MKEDILEQLVDDYLQWKGYFTRHNVKFKPAADHPEYDARKDCVASDIDVIGVDPRLDGPRRVMVVSCKAWQSGFNASGNLKALTSDKERAGRPAWKRFRELTMPKWSEAFVTAVEASTGSRQFTYVTAVTSLRGSASVWEKESRFMAALAGNPVEVWTLEMLFAEVYASLGTTVASSQLGRTLQLMKACGWTPPAPLDRRKSAVAAATAAGSSRSARPTR